ncbi:MAG: UDP-N-acetylmuramoyl-L-alanine--D-glutamate ligase [Pseudomonadota bacterium]|nr:UDP-N-acetylmuramoyl-L-alanine--D-glutamate ligase [Pseudomonadota bacterium]
MKHLKNLSVLVLGLGESGLAMARWCDRWGADVRVWDTRGRPAHAALLAQHVPHARWLDGPLNDAAFAGVERVFKSPGLAPIDERIHGPLQRAIDAGVPVQGELDLFAAALADLRAERGYAPEVLAITGTNGKTTTTAMTAQLVARAGRRVAVAGNIGPTMLQTLSDALDQALAGSSEAAAPSGLQFLPDVWVLELSSFQLHGVQGFEPSAAALLNLSQDHLDWHGTMADYTAAKRRVFGRHAVMVVNRDDAAVEALVPAPEVVRGAKGRKPLVVPRRVVRFGIGAPDRPGDFGLIEEGGMAWLVRAREVDETLQRGKSGIGGEELTLQRLMPVDALRVRGRHNAANALAALALATAIGCPLAPLLHGLRDYAGEPHRLALVATWDGVDAFDDSKGTNVGATVAALNGLGADKAPARLVVILGGDGKGQDFGPLTEPVRRHARAVATIGRDAERIGAALESTGVPLQRHATLQAATRWSFQQARPGDAVLLSPACASLDMFRNYVERAEVFVAEVQALMAEHGGVAA